MKKTKAKRLRLARERELLREELHKQPFLEFSMMLCSSCDPCGFGTVKQLFHTEEKEGGGARERECRDLEYMEPSQGRERRGRESSQGKDYISSLPRSLPRSLQHWDPHSGSLARSLSIFLLVQSDVLYLIWRICDCMYRYYVKQKL